MQADVGTWQQGSAAGRKHSIDECQVDSAAGTPSPGELTVHALVGDACTH